MESTTTHLHLPVWKLRAIHGCLYATSPLLFLWNNLFGDYRKCTLFFLYVLSQLWGHCKGTYIFINNRVGEKSWSHIHSLAVLCLWRSVSKSSYIGHLSNTMIMPSRNICFGHLIWPDFIHTHNNNKTCSYFP